MEVDLYAGAEAGTVAVKRILRRSHRASSERQPGRPDQIGLPFSFASPSSTREVATSTAPGLPRHVADDHVKGDRLSGPEAVVGLDGAPMLNALEPMLGTYADAISSPDLPL